MEVEVGEEEEEEEDAGTRNAFFGKEIAMSEAAPRMTVIATKMSMVDG